MGWCLSRPQETKNNVEISPKVKVLGVDPDFDFVLGDNHLAPSVLPLFIKGSVISKTYGFEVAEAQRKSNGEEILLKTIYRCHKDAAEIFKQEAELLGKLNHPNILKILDCYIDKENFYICTEHCRDGEMLQMIKKKKKFFEHEAAEYIRTIIQAVEYCHAQNVVHQHLVPENILFRGKDLVIVGFDGAKLVEDDRLYQDCCDILFSNDNLLIRTAPESIRERYGWEFKKSDMWDVGIITFVMLTGRAPFRGLDKKELYRKITNNRIDWPKKNRLSIPARDFVKKLLNYNAENRMSASEALEHAWINRKDGQESNRTDNGLGDEVLENIATYVETSKLKRVLVKMLSNQMTKSDQQILKKQFDDMDFNGDGVVDVKELTDFIFKHGGTKREAEMKANFIMEQVDQQGDQKISRNEWEDSRISARLSKSPGLIKSAFELMDRDSNGYITHKELSKYFNSALDDSLIFQLIKEVDENSDGQISYEEFIKAMRAENSVTNIGVKRVC